MNELIYMLLSTAYLFLECYSMLILNDYLLGFTFVIIFIFLFSFCLWIEDSSKKKGEKK
jgi:hypothetical protein